MLELLAARRPAWHEHAACRGMGPELFFPDRGEDVRPAKAVCARCPVRVRRELAGRAGAERGIWGGTSERTRKRTGRAA
ncbi:WhiB family transcriptional regulator [Iamia sp.]|uniref:WhiB family transcriptional regulator n=1 Tax=Iamia sp. TaxID=2722710 RepID=UPI002C42470F|nr:WhiB family transcriptional regulator [Iamia sp.]HXH56127.1 WhiB family transcriptional regulator [Iamia sp.]